jgi:hypothetical protein
MSKFTRRAVVFGGGAVIVAGLAGVEGPRLLRKRHAPSPYDDLLDKLDDRDAAAQIGEAMLAGNTGFNAERLAAALRPRLRHQDLSEVALKEAEESRVREVDGWVMPESLALLCALAAKVG